MSLVSSRLSLVHRCTIERGSGGDDDWGNPDVPTWAAHLSDVPCVVNMAAGRERADDGETVVIEDLRLILPLGTDVTETDRIGDITFRGDTIVAGPTGIRSVLRHRDHLELLLVRVI